MADHRRTLGVAGEDAVAAWYSNAGYALLDRNWRCREGELDLVVARDRAVVFCEVKTRRGTAFGAPFEAVTRHEATSPPHPRAALAVGASRAPRAGTALRRRLGARRAGHRPRDRRPRSGVLTVQRGQRARVRLALGATPAPGVPVAPLLGHALRHHDLVAETAGDLVVAARAPVDLHRLVRLHVRDLELVAAASCVIRTLPRARAPPPPRARSRRSPDRCRASLVPGTGSDPCRHRSGGRRHSRDAHYRRAHATTSVEHTHLQRRHGRRSCDRRRCCDPRPSCCNGSLESPVWKTCWRGWSSSPGHPRVGSSR